MPRFAADDMLWNRAKDAARKTANEGDESFWKIVASVYQKLGGAVKSSSKSKVEGEQRLFDDAIRCMDAMPQAEREAIESAADAAMFDDTVHCRSNEGAGVSLDDHSWKLGSEVEFQYVPAGIHSIQAGFRDGAISITVEVVPSTDASVIQASFESLKRERPKQKPFGCVEHREEEASFWPRAFVPKNDGVYVVGEPSGLGANNVNGKIHCSWSPSFYTDANYAAAKKENGVYRFPDGVRGSIGNPAKITGVAFCVGTLTNRPAFKNISPVRAKEAVEDKDVVTASGTSEGVRKEWETRHRLHPTQIAYAHAKAEHEAIAARVAKEKNEASSTLPPLREGINDEEIEKHIASHMAIEEKHGYWESHDKMRKAEDAMIGAAKEHMQRQPIYQRSEKQEDLKAVWEKAPKSYDLRPKIVDMAFKLDHNGGVQATDTTSPDTVKASKPDSEVILARLFSRAPESRKVDVLFAKLRSRAFGVPVKTVDTVMASAKETSVKVVLTKATDHTPTVNALFSRLSAGKAAGQPAA